MRGLLFAAFLSLMSFAQAFGFGAVSFMGQNGEHEKVTRIALKGLGIGKKTLNEIAGNKGALGAVGAADRPDRGLMDKHHVHCDGADYLDVPGYPQTRRRANKKLADCRDFIFRQLDKAVRLAGGIVSPDGRVKTREIPSTIGCIFDGQPGRAKCDSLGALGLAFHASQDFYSHSNWVDIPANGPTGPDNPPGLGQTGPAPFIDPNVRASLPEGLITGCFLAIPERLYCKYGNDKDRVRHRALNKDVGKLSIRSGIASRGDSERGRLNNNFARAVDAAIQDTRNKWKYFEQQILARYGAKRGDKIICALKNDDEDACM